MARKVKGGGLGGGDYPGENGNNLHRDLKIKATASTEEAVRSLQELDRQIKKLGDLADQGQHRQRGFLSRKQVEMYKNILKEMENNYKAHSGRLEEIRKEYDKRREKANQEYKEARQARVNATMNGASEKEVEHLKQRESKAKSQVESLSSKELEGLFKSMQNVLDKMETRMNQTEPHTERIDRMHERDPKWTDLSRGVLQGAASAGMVMSIHGLEHYIGKGIGRLRHEEQRGALLGQKLGATYGGDDAQMRLDAIKTGNKNQYDAYETLVTQWAMVNSGGTSGDKKLLANDTESVQSFGRAYSVDPVNMAYSTGTLKQMGTLKDGEMQKFANLIGGAVAKNGMRGREEEMVRATTNLLAQVGSNLPNLSEAAMGNVVAMQTDLGKVAPGLKGEKGAQALSTLDNMFKNSDNSLDVLMGKGNLPEFTGIKGAYRLKQMQQRGLSDPNNLKYMLQGAERLGWDDNYANMYISSKSGLSIDSLEAMRKSGLLDKWKKGDTGITKKQVDELKRLGATDEIDQLLNRKKSNTNTIEGNKAQDHKIQGSASKLPSRIFQGVSNLYHKLPDWMQVLAPWGMGLGMGIMGGGIRGRGTMTKFGDFLNKVFTKDIGKGGGFRNPFKDMKWSDITEKVKNIGKGGGTGTGGKGGGFFKSIPSTIGKVLKHLKPSNLSSTFSKIWAGAKSQGSGMAEWLSTTGVKLSGESIEKSGFSAILKKIGGGILKGGSSIAKLGSKALPFVGTAVDVGIDRVSNPNTSWGRSLLKGIFGTIGTVAGLGISAAAGVPTGGVGTAATIGLAGGMGAGGSKLGDMIYSGIFGDGDKDSAEKIKLQKEQNNLLSEQAKNEALKNSSSPNDITVDKLNIQDKDFAQYVQKDKGAGVTNRPTTATSGESPDILRNILNGVSKDYNLNININGDVKGMSKDNQEDIADSLTDFFSHLFMTRTPNTNTGVDLSVNQKFK